MKNKAFFSGIFLFFLSISIAFSQPDLVAIPFRTVSKMIIIQGSIDDRFGNLVIDTGISGMALNEAYFSAYAVSTLYKNKEYGGFESALGDAPYWGETLAKVNIQDFSFKMFASVIDLRPVEEQKRTNILGVIGVRPFKELQYELVIDYFSMEIQLYRLDKKGKRLHRAPQPLPSETLSFYEDGHLPTITASLYGMPLRLGLDSGAELNLLPMKILNKYRDQFKEVQAKEILDLGGGKATAFSAQVRDLQIGSLAMPPMNTLFIPYSANRGGLSHKSRHGLLGYEFFRHFRTAINFVKREIYLWDEQALENAPVVSQN